MKALDDYFALRDVIFAYFGYEEDWCVLPINDNRCRYWYLDGDGPGTVHFAESEDELASGEGNCYDDEILPKGVYRGAECTMIAVDTRTDGNKFLRVFSNAKERECPEE